MMTLKLFESTSVAGWPRLTYEISHSTPGRDGTTLTAELVLGIGPERSCCKIDIPECDAPTHGDALGRMASWLRRLADGIEQRKEVSIPL